MTERCTRCGDSEPSSLCRRDDQVYCYECLCALDGKQTAEKHHPLGRDNADDAFWVPGNLHRFLTARQRARPEPLRHNVGRDPLLVLAALLRAFADFCAYAVRYFYRFSDWLIALSGYLAEQWGPEWWKSIDVGPAWT